MGRKIIIADRDENYARRLAAEFLSEFAFDGRVQIITDPIFFTEAQEQLSADWILLTREFLSGKTNPSFSCPYLLLSDREDRPDQNTLFKYQPVKNLISSMEALIPEKLMIPKGVLLLISGISGVFESEELTLAAASVLCERGRTLVINMDAFSFRFVGYDSEDTASLSDELFYFRHQTPMEQQRRRPYTDHNCIYLSPFLGQEDREIWLEDDFAQFFFYLQQETKADYTLVHMEGITPDFLRMLPVSSQAVLVGADLPPIRSRGERMKTFLHSFQGGAFNYCETFYCSASISAGVNDRECSSQEQQGEWKKEALKCLQKIKTWN